MAKHRSVSKFFREHFSSSNSASAQAEVLVPALTEDEVHSATSSQGMIQELGTSDSQRDQDDIILTAEIGPRMIPVPTEMNSGIVVESRYTKSPRTPETKLEDERRIQNQVEANNEFAAEGWRKKRSMKEKADCDHYEVITTINDTGFRPTTIYQSSKKDPNKKTLIGRGSAKLSATHTSEFLIESFLRKGPPFDDPPVTRNDDFGVTKYGKFESVEDMILYDESFSEILPARQNDIYPKSKVHEWVNQKGIDLSENDIYTRSPDFELTNDVVPHGSGRPGAHYNFHYKSTGEYPKREVFLVQTSKESTEYKVVFSNCVWTDKPVEEAPNDQGSQS